MSLEGTQLGRFYLIRLLGSGGMGEVYLSEDTRINRQVAIKVIRAENGAYPDGKAAKEAAYLFEREMRAVSRLDHPNILPLFEFGEENINGATVAYMVMPFRQEGSFSTWLQQQSSAKLLSPQEVAYVINQAADALQHAHDHQIVHQDVKPANFLIRSRTNFALPNLLLTDFGVAKFTSATANMSQNVRGTPTYMAPEQWNGHPVPATDQYALAIMAYELLTGRAPFAGPLGTIMYQHLMTAPQPPSSLNPGISPAIDAVILRALAKEPEARFPSISAFAQAFQSAVRGIDDVETVSSRTEGAPDVLPSEMTSISTIPSTQDAYPPDSASIAGGGSFIQPTLPVEMHQEKSPETVASTPPTSVPEVLILPPDIKTGKVVPAPRKWFSGGKKYLIIAIVILLILTSVGIYLYAKNSNTTALSVHPTALSPSSCQAVAYTNYQCTVTLSNSGGQTLSWSAGSIVHSDTFSPSIGTLSPGQSEQVTILTSADPCNNDTFIFSFSSHSQSLPQKFDVTWSC